MRMTTEVIIKTTNKKIQVIRDSTGVQPGTGEIIRKEYLHIIDKKRKI